MSALASKTIDAGPAPDGTATAIPSRAQVVVVGGGAIGCSVAYHLAKLGMRDVLLLEREALGCGTTWHSHGVVGLTRANPTLLRMAMETARLIPELEAETGRATGYAVRGSVNVTADPSRLTQFKRFADIATMHGLDACIVDAAEAERLYPLMDPEDVLGALHLPTEGQCNPLDLTQALAVGARGRGVRIAEGVAVTGARVEGGRIRAVETNRGTVECETVVNCTGLWGRDFLRAETGGLPLQAIEHNYLVAEFSEAVGPHLPLLRDPDQVMTLREDNGQLSVGFNEHEGKLFAEDGVPDGFAFDELPPDWDAIAPYFEGAARRVPILNELGVRLFLCGPEAATPDTRYLLGPSPELGGLFVAAGFCGVGIGSAGGAGLAVAEWIVHGHPRKDAWNVDLRRMAPHQSTRRYLARRTPESNGQLFAMNWPHRQNLSARPVRRSPLHAEMAAARACFREEAGWEVPEWFAPEGVEPAPRYSFERPTWFPFAQAETAAARGSVAIADRSAVGKFLVTGPGAERALSRVAAIDPVAQDGPVLIPLLNERGGVEALFTAVRRAQDRLLLIGETATQRRDLAVLRAAFAKRPEIAVLDVTAGYAAVEVIGPEATRTLREAGWTGDPARGWDPAAEIGFTRCTVLASSRLAAPCWVVLTSSECGVALLSALREVAPALRPIGLHARHALLTYAGSPVWGQGLTPDRSLGEAGMLGGIDLSQNRPFVGRGRCERDRREGAASKLCLVTLIEQEPVLVGHEPVRLGGASAGAIDQPAYPLSSPKAAGLAYLGSAPLSEWTTSDACEVRVAGIWRPATFRILGPNFDTEGAKDQVSHIEAVV